MYTVLDVEPTVVTDVLRRDPSLSSLADTAGSTDLGGLRLLHIEGAEGGLLVMTRVWHDPYHDYADGDLTLEWLSPELVQGIIDATLAQRIRWKQQRSAYAKVQAENEEALYRMCGNAQEHREADPNYVPLVITPRGDYEPFVIQGREEGEVEREGFDDIVVPEPVEGSMASGGTPWTLTTEWPQGGLEVVVKEDGEVKVVTEEDTDA